MRNREEDVEEEANATLDTFATTNPATDEPLETYERTSRDELESILATLRDGFVSWSTRPLEERLVPLRRAATLLEKRALEYATLMAREMGKPREQGGAEALKCAAACKYYADKTAEFLAPRRIETGALASYVAYEPLGPILAIMPWNFPFWQVFRFVAPNLAAGNVAILKHADNTAGCAVAIEELLFEAGFPRDTFRSIFVDHATAADVIRDPRVAAVTLTGSTRAGRAVAEVAGSALKKCVLELGGSDPYVVLEDADIEHAARVCVTSRLINSGQSCIAAKRFICVERQLAAFTELVVGMMREKRWGDPLAEDQPDLGPMARHDLRDALHDQVVRSVRQGADLLLGGHVPEEPGAFYPPTVLGGVKPGVAAFDEEMFGPVAAIVAARDEQEAVELANRTTFGLGAAVITGDVEKGERIARDSLRAGACFVNDFVRSDPALPFGGIKDSGYGRELSSHGMHEFMNVKTIVVSAKGV